jgi:hypothetical protein
MVRHYNVRLLRLSTSLVARSQRASGHLSVANTMVDTRGPFFVLVWQYTVSPCTPGRAQFEDLAFRISRLMMRHLVTMVDRNFQV